MISDLIFAKNKSSETATETSNYVVDILIQQLQIDPDELNMEFDHVQRLALNSTRSKIQHRKTVANGICHFNSFKEKLYAKQK